MLNSYRNKVLFSFLPCCVVISFSDISQKVFCTAAEKEERGGRSLSWCIWWFKMILQISPGPESPPNKSYTQPPNFLGNWKIFQNFFLFGRHFPMFRWEFSFLPTKYIWDIRNFVFDAKHFIPLKGTVSKDFLYVFFSINNSFRHPMAVFIFFLHF